MEKAISIFKSKCRLYSIPEEFVDIIVDLSLQKNESAKENIAILIEKKSTEMLKITLPRDLTESLLNLIFRRKGEVKDSQSIMIITQQIFSCVLEFTVRNAFPDQSFPSANFKKMAVKILGLIEAVRRLDKMKIMGEVKDLIQVMQLVDAKIMGLVLSLFELIECFIEKGSDIELKHKIQKILDSGNFPEECSVLFSMLMFSSKDDPIITLQGRALEKYDQYVHQFNKLLLRVSIPSLSNKNILILSKLSSFVVMFIKGGTEKKIKNK